MSFRKWLNDHSLVLSSFGVSTIVALLYLFSTGLYLSFTRLPYLAVEYKFQDWIAQLGRAAPKDPRLYFLAYDAPSHDLDQVWEEDFVASPVLRKMKAPDWPRDVYGTILDRLAGAGALAVTFDFMYKGSNTGDAEFRAMLDQHRERVVIGSQIDSIKRGLNKRPRLSPPSTLVPEASDPRLGFVNIFPDADGIIRSFQFRTTLMELANLRPDPGDPEFDSLAARTLGQAGFGDRIPPGRGLHRIRYAWKGETLRLQKGESQSLADIFIPSLWEANYKNGEFFRGKIVLVGPEGNFTKDVAESPFGVIAGPEFHLNAMNAMLTGAFLQESPAWVDFALIFAGGLLALLAGWTLSHALVRIGLILVVAAVFFRAAVWLYDQQNLVIPVFSPLLSLVGSGFTFVVWQQLIERLEKARLRKTFERYVSRDIVKELLDNPESYLNTVGGARKRITILFSDVRGFTTITESGDAQTLVKQLNEYFDQMVEIVFANRGTLDKFIGDAVMAQWGGITTQGEQQDAINAVRTAVQMRKRLTELNAGWVPRGMLELKFGIGINTGEAIVGNLGSHEKAEISAIGDAVNTASRLEGITKEYHNDMVIGETVAEHVRDTFFLRTVGFNQPKGKTKPLELFTVIDERAPGTAEPRWLAKHEEGVRLFRAREFAAAIDCFNAVLAEIPDDWLAADYIEDCREFLENPPPPDWTSVKIMKSK